MNFTRIKEILEILSRVGVDEVALESKESEETGTNMTQVRGASTDRQIVVHYTFDEDMLSGNSIGISALKPFLSRLNLFDMDKIKVTHTSQPNGQVDQLTIKEGRRKITYRCYDIDYLGVPSQIPSNLSADDKLEFDSERVLYWIKVGNSIIQTANEKVDAKVSFKYDSSEGKAVICIEDGGEDQYVEEIELGTDLVETIDRSVWSLLPFSKLMKEALAHGDQVRFGVTENGVAIVRIKDIDIALSPL